MTASPAEDSPQQGAVCLPEIYALCAYWGAGMGLGLTLCLYHALGMIRLLLLKMNPKFC